MNAKKVGSKTMVFRGQGEFKGHRFHLRIDSEQKGVLIIDASRLIFLNGTAVDYAAHILAGDDAVKTYKALGKKYRKLKKQEVTDDYNSVKSQLVNYIAGNTDIIETVGQESPLMGADELPSPYRMDIALTYRCQNRCGHCYNETKEKPETDVETWKKTLEWLWGVGIPHIVFTGGEPTLYEGLKKLISKSEELGQITGLITNGRNLARPDYLKELVNTGLDHVQITMLSHLESQHDELAGGKGAWKETVAGIKAALAEDLYVSTNTTIMKGTLADITETMEFLIFLGVKNIAFNALIRSGQGKSTEGITFDELAAALEKLRRIAAEHDANLIWYAPTPYCEFNPVNYGLGIKQCTACSINMAMEPDGTVIPCQSYYQPLGKALGDWDKIWNNELCKRIRERKYMPEKCKNCGMWQLCGGGCPLSIEHGDYLCGDRFSNP
ncbi:MAG: radical SAM protein [Candidatus Thermoplasmatota archaeon]|nr:radical SAM protein [Candidatus Thermoplasmatota archaeon]MBU4071920.1 radical SAM protein [Candidatus Thermoplasmatota archaeon]MBU4144207.1 radical SAM protein [Candidatus Thermoplasmatota archaeon]MBU4591095.1 radical SAM protein [Candidatus Thermoplasmatota archaeon]